MKVWKKWSLFSFLLILVLSIGLLGCGAATDEAQPENAQEETNETAQQETQGDAATEAFPITLTDGAGNELTIEAEPASIVSVLPSNTEMAYALGLGDKIVGVSAWDNYPEEVLEVEKVGDMTMDVEKILSLTPDLILMSPSQYTNQADAVQTLNDAGIHVLVIQDATSFADVYASLRLIAQATGAVEQAEEIIQDMETRLAEIKQKAEAVQEPKRVWVEVSPAPDIYTTGSGTFMHEMLESIKAINVAGDQQGWVSLTEEEIVQLNPDVIITTYGYYVENPVEQVLSRSGWGEVPAVKEQQIFDVDNDTVTRPGPRLIDGVETLAKLIYPEIFE